MFRFDSVGYLVYMHNSKSLSNAERMAATDFMRHCIVELYGIDFECSYQHMFSCIPIFYFGVCSWLVKIYDNWPWHCRRPWKALIHKPSGKFMDGNTWMLSVSGPMCCALTRTKSSYAIWCTLLSKWLRYSYPRCNDRFLIRCQGSITLDAQVKYYPYRLHLIRVLNNLAVKHTTTFINSTRFSLDVCWFF